MTATAAPQVNRNTFNRPDTFFGICEAIGQDFGFNPLWLRLAFVPPIFFAPLLALGAYVALGIVVLASRLIFPAKNAHVVTVAAPVLVTSAPADTVHAVNSDERLPLAA